MNQEPVANVLFRAGGQSFAIASSCVRSIHDELAVQAVGDTQHWFLGLAVADGVLIPVTDFGGYLQLTKATGRTLSFSENVGLGALRVDEVLGVDEGAVTRKDAVLPQALQKHAELFSGAVDAATGEHWVLDVPRLLQSKRFVEISASKSGLAVGPNGGPL